MTSGKWRLSCLGLNVLNVYHVSKTGTSQPVTGHASYPISSPTANVTRPCGTIRYMYLVPTIHAMLKHERQLCNKCQCQVFMYWAKRNQNVNEHTMFIRNGTMLIVFILKNISYFVHSPVVVILSLRGLRNQNIYIYNSSKISMGIFTGIVSFVN